MRDVSARKLQTWIQKIKLVSGPDRSEPAKEEGEEANNEEGEDPKEEQEETKSSKSAPQIDHAQTTSLDGADVFDNIQAVVRLKIPKVAPEPQLNEEGEPIEVEYDESELEDIPFEDRCLQIVTKIEEQRIWVINQMASKTLRTEISAEFRATVERLDNLDTQDFNFRLEKEAASFEDGILKLLADTPENAESKAPKVPLFDFRPKY